MPDRCGGCTLCCDLLEVAALQKPANAPCQHCALGVGCMIYAQPERPSACSAYQCAYLFNETWPDELRPDRCGVVFEPFNEDEHLTFAACVSLDWPTAWREGAAAVAIEHMMRTDCAVIVVVGKEKHVLLPPGQTPEMVWNRYERAARRAWQHRPTPPT
jgi:hypothetical protein